MFKITAFSSGRFTIKFAINILVVVALERNPNPTRISRNSIPNAYCKYVNTKYNIDVINKMQFLALFVRSVTNEMELVFCNTIKEFIIFHYHHKLSICLILHLCQNTYGTVYHFLSSHRHRSLLNLK